MLELTKLYTRDSGRQGLSMEKVAITMGLTNTTMVTGSMTKGTDVGYTNFQEVFITGSGVRGSEKGQAL